MKRDPLEGIYSICPDLARYIKSSWVSNSCLTETQDEYIITGLYMMDYVTNVQVTVNKLDKSFSITFTCPSSNYLCNTYGFDAFYTKAIESALLLNYLQSFEATFNDELGTLTLLYIRPSNGNYEFGGLGMTFLHIHINSYMELVNELIRNLNN